MPSQLDSFLSQCVTASNAVIGTESVTLSGGTILTGVWSSVAATSEAAFGGEQGMMTASVIVPSATAVSKALIGQRATYGTIKLRVTNVDVGTSETTVYFNDDTEGIKL